MSNFVLRFFLRSIYLLVHLSRHAILGFLVSLVGLEVREILGVRLGRGHPRNNKGINHYFKIKIRINNIVILNH